MTTLNNSHEYNHIYLNLTLKLNTYQTIILSKLELIRLRFTNDIKRNHLKFKIEKQCFIAKI